MKIVALTFLLPLLLTSSCGVEESQSSQATIPSPRIKTTVFVVSGGYNSCEKNDHDNRSSPYGMDMFEPGRALATTYAIRKNSKIRFIVSCFRGSIRSSARWRSRRRRSSVMYARPRSSAARGESMATGCPSIAIDSATGL